MKRVIRQPATNADHLGPDADRSSHARRGRLDLPVDAEQLRVLPGRAHDDRLPVVERHLEVVVGDPAAERLHVERTSGPDRRDDVLGVHERILLPAPERNEHPPSGTRPSSVDLDTLAVDACSARRRPRLPASRRPRGALGPGRVRGSRGVRARRAPCGDPPAGRDGDRPGRCCRAARLLGRADAAGRRRPRPGAVRRGAPRQGLRRRPGSRRGRDRAGPARRSPAGCRRSRSAAACRS